MPNPPADRWPSIPVADWQDARDTLHRHTLPDPCSHLDTVHGRGAVHAPRVFAALQELATR